MWTRSRSIAGLASLCLLAVGCRSAMDCGGRCTGGSPLAGMRYDCSCETEAKPCMSCRRGCGASCDPRANAGGSCGPCQASCVNRLSGCTGCGDLYWNEWFNDPPALHQPCDCNENFTGPGAQSIYVTSYRRREFDPGNPAAMWAGEPQEHIAQADAVATRK